VPNLLWEALCRCSAASFLILLSGDGAAIPPSRFFRQRKHIKRVAARRIVNVRKDRARHVARAAAAEAGGDGDILFAADAERYRKTLHRCAEAGLPQRFSGVDVDGAEDSVEIADERDAASGR
jgi:hypothetical protein